MSLKKNLYWKSDVCVLSVPHSSIWGDESWKDFPEKFSLSLKNNFKTT